MLYDTRNLNSTIISEMKKEIMDLLPVISHLDKLVLFNIGTEIIDFDSFGPILGSMLETKLKEPRFKELSMFLDVIGTINDPCHGINLPIKYEIFENTYKDMNIFTICTNSAGTQKTNSYNKIKISNRQLKPNKSSKGIGDVSICMSTIYANNLNMMGISRHRVNKRHINNTCDYVSDIILEAVRDKMLQEF